MGESDLARKKPRVQSSHSTKRAIIIIGILFFIFGL